MNSDPYAEFTQGAGKLGISLSDGHLTKIQHFCQILNEWNEQINLVSNSQPAVLLQDHILDSLTLAEKIGSDKGTLIDIGSGAGFPGLILAIALDKLHATLVEAVGKKARFLEDAIKRLSLQDRIVVLNGRAEILAHQPNLRHRFDFVTCRAVGELELVMEISLPFLKPKGLALLQRSVGQYQEEEFIARKSVAKLAGTFKEVLFPDKEVLGKERAILVFEQVAPAPSCYPRPWQKLKKAKAATPKS